jgi:hypothetical protein
MYWSYMEWHYVFAQADFWSVCSWCNQSLNGRLTETHCEHPSQLSVIRFQELGVSGVNGDSIGLDQGITYKYPF